MHKSTFVWAVLASLLAVALVVTGWQLLRPGSSLLPRVEGTAVAQGLPGLLAGEELLPSRAALLYDHESATIKFEQNGFERMPIASITKLMTAMVALDYGIDWDQSATIHLNEYVAGSRLLLHPGEEVAMRDLFYASLLGSANNATLAYVRELGIPEDEFILRMNRKAIELELEQTTFTDVTGLDTGNVSTAYDVARMAAVAFTEYPEIAEATGRYEYTFTVPSSGREHTMRNPNKLVTGEKNDFNASKTGFLYEAGYCLVAQGAGDRSNRIAVVLGGPSERQHFLDMERLISLPR